MCVLNPCRFRYPVMQNERRLILPQNLLRYPASLKSPSSLPRHPSVDCRAASRARRFLPPWSPPFRTRCLLQAVLENRLTRRMTQTHFKMPVVKDYPQATCRTGYRRVQASPNHPLLDLVISKWTSVAKMCRCQKGLTFNQDKP